MSALDRLTQAKSSTKNDYEVRKTEATARARPPGTQNVNKRTLQKSLKLVGDAWRAYYDAALNLVDRGVYAEEQDRIDARNQLAQESMAHVDWFEGVEDILTALEDPPVQVGLNSAQILSGLEADIEASQVSVRKRLEDTETSLNDATAPATKLRLEALKEIVEEVKQTVQGSISELFDQKANEAPEQVQVTTRAKRDFISEVLTHVDALKVLIAAKMPEEVRETPLKTILANNDTIMVDPVYHTAGELNIADMATRGKAEIKDVGYGSIWQSGPSYLREKRESWPVSRDFLKRACNPAAAGKTSAVWPGRGIRTASPHLNQAENLPQPSSAAQPEPQALAINLIPKEELRNKFYTFVNHFSSFKSFSSLKRIMNYSDSLVKVSGIMARYIIASRCKDKRSIYDELTVLDYERAAYMMLVVAMEETVEMLTTQDLSGLAVYWDGCVCWTKGRMGLAMKALLGPEKLAVLSPKSRLARLFMIMAHEEDHRRNAGDTLFRSRKFAWIVRGRNLAQSVVKKCEFCKVHQQKTLEQQMGDLPKEKFDVPCKPFTHLCVDLAGPYMVKAMNNARSKLKVWPVLFNCLNTGAVDIRLAYKQGTDAFLTAWNTFRAIRGDPDTVYSDRGSNLKKAATFVEEEDPEKWGWDEISKSSAKKGTVWRFTPPGCQFRDGLAESRVKMMKKSLVHLHSGGELNYAEFECVLAKAASVINDRPLGIRVHNKTEGDLVPVTPNLLLMAKTATSAKDNNLSEEGPSRLVKNQKRMEEVVGAWWNEWYSQVFSSLVPYNKWKKEKPNLEVGDVCLVKYDHKVGKADYRICKVEEVEMDAKGLVRTVIVGMRPRDSREKSLPYKSKKLKSLKLAIQRLILICPAKEVKELLDENEDEITGHATTVFIAAKPDWNKLCESDDRAEYLEDDDAGDVGVPDGVRPAVPDVQLLQAPPLYALPAYRECRPGTCYESNCGLVKEPVLNPLNIQANVPRDCLFEHDEAMIEVQNEVDATVTTLCVHKDFDVDTEQS